MYKLEDVTTVEQLKKLYDGSALTFEGTSTDDENMTFLVEWLKKTGANPIDDIPVYVTKGKLMNDTFELTGDNAYPDDLSIVSVELDDLENWGAIVTERFKLHGRWMDDVIVNNLSREGKGSWEDEDPALFGRSE